MKIIFISILIICFVTSCSLISKMPSDNILYQKAIQNAIYPEKTKIDTNLVAITEQNPDIVWKTIKNEKYILVVAWKQNVDFYKKYLDTLYNTGSYPIWVTTASELKKRFKNEVVKDTTMRLKQLLGLPPTATYSYFVEFWVKPKDLFRPCPDKEINDKKCETCFTSNSDTKHIKWINDNRISRYYQCNLYDQYPWTQLGYTYDWCPNNKSHIGVSEFVIDINKNIMVNKIYTTSKYINIK
jgi:hypothetical protein